MRAVLTCRDADVDVRQGRHVAPPREESIAYLNQKIDKA